jgi:hypothetical protein
MADLDLVFAHGHNDALVLSRHAPSVGTSGLLRHFRVMRSVGAWVARRTAMRNGVLLLLVTSCGASETAMHSTELEAPAWIGNASYVISRGCSGIPCAMDQHPLAEGYVFDDWAYERAVTTSGWFEVWQPGVTDWDNPDTWRELDVRLYWRVGGVGDFQWKWINIAGRTGNNTGYAFSLRDLDPFFNPSRGGRISIENAEDCPNVPFRVGDGGSSLAIDVELFVSVNGAELRPAPGAAFHGTYSTAMVTPGVCCSATVRASRAPSPSAAAR